MSFLKTGPRVAPEIQSDTSTANVRIAGAAAANQTAVLAGAGEVSLQTSLTKANATAIAKTTVGDKNDIGIADVLKLNLKPLDGKAIEERVGEQVSLNGRAAAVYEGAMEQTATANAAVVAGEQ